LKERIQNFGNETPLLGIVTEPDPAQRIADAPWIVILNAGLLHHVGPYRLHVELAKRMAAEGYPVLRFDLAGIGDSAARAGGKSNEETVLGNIRDATDHLAQHFDARRFVLMGLCSGAKNSHNAAVADPRIKAIALLDGFAFKTRAYYFWYYARRVFQLGRWRNFVRLRWQRWLGKSSDTSSDGSNQWRLPLPSKSGYAAGLKTLIERDQKMLYIYTGGTGGYSYRNQFRDAFRSIDFRDTLQLEFFEKADHTFTVMRDRDRMKQLLIGWLQQHFPRNSGENP